MWLCAGWPSVVCRADSSRGRWAHLLHESQPDGEVLDSGHAAAAALLQGHAAHSGEQLGHVAASGRGLQGQLEAADAHGERLIGHSCQVQQVSTGQACFPLQC